MIGPLFFIVYINDMVGVLGECGVKFTGRRCCHILTMVLYFITMFHPVFEIRGGQGGYPPPP